MPKVVCIVQARTGSTRLPGKVLREVRGKTLLEHLVDRLKAGKSIDRIVLATTVKASDDAIVEVAKQTGVGWFRGSEDDVLSRYVGAAQAYEAEVVIRVTSDCPLIDPGVIDRVVDLYFRSGVDYASNTIERTYPRGLDVEVFSMQALLRAEALSSKLPSGQISERSLEQLPGHSTAHPYREHVTLYMYRHPEKFSLANLAAEGELHWPEVRLCVDTPEDFLLIETIYRELYQEGEIINITDVIGLLKSQPELLQINAHVEQRQV